MATYCLGDGSLFPLRWDRAEGHLPSEHSVRDDRLYIPRVSADDSGVYVCSVRTAQQHFRAEITLSVEGNVTGEGGSASFVWPLQFL